MDFIYDIETYPNVFLLTIEHANAPLIWVFEISQRVNQSEDIIKFIDYLKSINARMVGFNNLGFDYPVLHTLLRMKKSDAATLYRKVEAIFGSQSNDDQFAHTIYPKDRYIDQIDLYKIHHFDNKARATGLKVLEFNKRSDTIEELPFKPGTYLTLEQIEILREYNIYDVQQTKKFYHHTLDMIRFREELTRKYQRDFMNHNDAKIGKDYFIMKMEEANIPCYDFTPEGRKPKQTRRSHIHLKDAILPWIKFEHSEFNRILDWLKEQTITETKGIFKDLIASINGFEFVFGLGGIHGSLESTVIESDDDYIILDLDASSYYPNLAIKNKFYPEHLGESFCDIYKYLYEQRKNYKKDTIENLMLKMALNGVYGDSNNPFSVFHDPLFTMKITLNGQLLLCLLAEQLIKRNELIQINTDGLTIRVHKKDLSFVRCLTAWWEACTGLELEEYQYKRMFVRDVNNYIAEYDDGYIKRKGAYEHQLGWHQDHSAIIVPKVAELVLITGVPIRETIESWENEMDFMLRAKVPKSSYLTIEMNGEEERLPNVTRYYIAKGGGNLFKWMPPLKNKTEWRKISVQSGWGIQVCNNMKDFGKLPIDYNFYIQEVEKLCLGLN